MHPVFVLGCICIQISVICQTKELPYEAQLKSAGLVTVARGTGGIELTRDLSEITFYDVYKAIGAVENGDLFHFHDAPNPECPVGRNIHALLDDKLKAVQNAMEDELRKYTLLDLRSGMTELLAKDN